MRKPPKRDTVLLEIAAAIGAGRIAIGHIDMGDNEHVHGVTFSDGSIVINPAVEIVDTVLHEVLHRLRPAWSERAVRARTRRLMNTLSHAEVECLYTLVMSSVVSERRRKRRKKKAA